MTKTVPLALLAAAALAVGACSQKTQDAASDTANSAATDFNATTRNAVDDVNAATDKALNSAQHSIDNAQPSLDHAVDKAEAAGERAKEKTGDALRSAGNAVDR